MSNYEKLVTTIRDMGGVVVGYSGGVDSTLVAKAAKEALGDNAVCVLVDSCLMPRSEVDEAAAIAGGLGINLMRVNADALSISNVSENKPDRCYYCKMAIFTKIGEIAQLHGLKYVLDGSNADDSADYRPGTKATQELGVKSPLKELGFTKERVRVISKELGLPTWNRPSYACLASRVPYGTHLTREILGQIEAAESILKEMGFKQFRVRHHGNLARIELLPEEMETAIAADARNLLIHRLRAVGYTYVTIDLAGYRTGSMNEGIES